MIRYLGFMAAALLAQTVAAQDGSALAAEASDADGAALAQTEPTPAEAEGADAVDPVEPPPALRVVDAAEVSMDDFLWTSRPVVVFADTPADPRYQEQLELLLARPEGLIARDVVVITDTDPAARSSVRLKLRPRGFQLTLIEKDGKVNLRKPFPWDVREITRAIDKWPLRQQEIRARLTGE